MGKPEDLFSSLNEDNAPPANRYPEAGRNPQDSYRQNMTEGAIPENALPKYNAAQNGGNTNSSPFAYGGPADSPGSPQAGGLVGPPRPTSGVLSNKASSSANPFTTMPAANVNTMTPQYRSGGVFGDNTNQSSFRSEPGQRSVASGFGAFQTMPGVDVNTMTPDYSGSGKFRGDAPPAANGGYGLNVPENKFKPNSNPTSPYYSPSGQYENQPNYAPQINMVSPQRGINRAAFYQNPRADQDRANMMAYEQEAANRQAATVDRTKIGTVANIQSQKTNAFDAAAAQGSAAQIDPYQRSLGYMVPGAATSDNVYMNPAALSSGANISREDMDFRRQQQALASQTMSQAAGAGPSVATQQLNEGLAANIAAQQSLAASQRGFGNAGLTQRQLQLQAADANMKTQQEAAKMRVQEQQQGIQNAAGLTTGARQQDIGLGTSQAGFNQQSGLANQQYLNQFSLQAAQNQLQNQQFNVGNINQQDLARANLAQNNQQFNASNANQFLLQQGAYNQQASMTNLTNAQQMALANQQARLQAAGTNAAVQNQFTLSQAQLDQQTTLANLQSYYQNLGMSDSQIQALLASRTNLDLQRQQAQMAFETTQTNANLNLASQQAQLQNAAANREQQTMGNYIAGGATLGAGLIAALSDRNRKKNITTMSDKQVNKFLYSLEDIRKGDYK